MDKCSGGLDVSERALLAMLGGVRFVRGNVISDSAAERDRLEGLVAESGLEGIASGLGQWRAASAEDKNLVGNYTQSSGTSTLTALQVGTLNEFVASGSVFPGFGAGFENLRVGDLVLLRGQLNFKENGLYQVLSLGSRSAYWILGRVRMEGITKSSLKRKLRGGETYVPSYDEQGSADLARRYLERSFGSWKVAGFDASLGEACVEMGTGVRLSVRVRKPAI